MDIKFEMSLSPCRIIYHAFKNLKGVLVHYRRRGNTQQTNLVFWLFVFIICFHYSQNK